MDTNERKLDKPEGDGAVFDDSLETFAALLESDRQQRGNDNEDFPGSFTLSTLQVLEKPPLAEELIEPDSNASPCTCNAVCECVPVETCGCFSVCECDTVDSCPSNVNVCSCNVVFFVPC